MNIFPTFSSNYLVIWFFQFDWEGDLPLKYPQRDLIIYEMHVRGFTRDESSKTENPGTYLGVMEKLDHLKVEFWAHLDWHGFLNKFCLKMRWMVWLVYTHISAENLILCSCMGTLCQAWRHGLGCKIWHYRCNDMKKPWLDMKIIG